jgi:hypothetical protein
MAKIRYCNLCDKNIVAHKKFKLTRFILLLFCGFIPGCIYLALYVLKSGDVCPSCGNPNLLPQDTKAKLIQSEK